MKPSDKTYRGPEIDDPEILQDVPPALRELLAEDNGFIAYGGGLHVRGACLEPKWHSLREAMEGPHAFHKLYPGEVDMTDVPFAQDCSGDQFLIRGGVVHQLSAEVGEVDSVDMRLPEFLDYAFNDPVDVLCMHPLLQFQKNGGRLQPGRLLLAYPPFCTGNSGASASLKDVEAHEVLSYHADLAKQIAELGDGEDLTLQVGE